MGLELYVDPLSQPCRVVYIFAKKNRIPFELRYVDFLKGETISKDFTQLSSLQRVPVLKDGDFVLSESVAILFYMISKYKTDSHWYPSDPHIRARIHEYLGWHGDLVRGTFGVPLWVKVFAPISGLQIPEEKVERNKDLMDKTLHRMEEYFLGNKLFLAGQEMTIADLLALEELMQPLGAGYDLLAGHKKLEAWRNRVETFLGADLVKEAHHTIMNIVQVSATTTIPPPPPGLYPYMRLRIAKIP
ncbi:glutathione S-transferase theta-2B-like isoform X1 [Suncus etruscus]|uniref:glutathione S-transferase theta-2B-like isoform X1 n=1 Tax=Suncus etruscus TaxID=109475 RepID=UPI00210F2803|nr:glutathione S-transferase theta-2B-like isoform X1 [Suncus etruscus]